MDKSSEIDTRLTSLIPLTDQADIGPIANFAHAIRRNVNDWLGGDQPRFQPALQIDFAIGPPRCRAFFLAAADDEAMACQKDLMARLEPLPTPRVCGLVAFSLFCDWDHPNKVPVTYDWVAPPFGRLLAQADFDNEIAVKVPLYQQLSRSHPNYASPLRTRRLPPWHQRLWHILSGKPFAPGFLLGRSREVEIQEPLPYHPPSDWLDEQHLVEANQRDVDELKQLVADGGGLMVEYALALRLHEQGAISESIVHLDACLARFPEAVQLHCTRAEWSLGNSQLEDGLRHSQKIIELAPHWAAGHYLRGHVYMSLDAWEQAESDFVRATECHPSKFASWMWLAQVLAHLQKTEQALAAVDQALECDPYDPDALAFRIQLLPHAQQTSEQFDEVLRRIDGDLTTALRYTPPHPYFLTCRAEQALKSGKPEQTIEQCNEALSLDENDARAFSMRGVAYLELEEVDQAFNDLNRALDLGGEAPAVLEARARIQLQRGELASARLDCERAIDIEEKFVLAYLTLASTLVELEEPAEALSALRKVAELAPEWDGSHRALGDFHMHQGDVEQAFAFYSKAVNCGQQTAINWLQRGQCQVARRNWEKAVFDLDKAIELDGELAEAHRARATVNLARHEMDDAIQDLTEVLRRVPDDVVSRFQRAQCHLAKKKPVEAREDFDQVIELCPTLAAAYCGRATTWIESGDQTRAAEDFREATIQDPLSADDFEISRILAEAAMLQRVDDYEAALRKIEEALEVNPDSEQALAIRASCYWHDEQFVEAADDYTCLLDQLSNNDEDRIKRLACLNNRGHVYAELGEFGKGLTDLNEAVQMAEAFGSRECQAYSLSGRALAQAGLNELDKTRADFQRSINKKPTNAWVYYNQALVYEKMGKPHEAAVCFKLALALEEPPLPARKRERARAYVQRQGTSGMPNS